jgi:hypothetical protein
MFQLPIPRYAALRHASGLERYSTIHILGGGNTDVMQTCAVDYMYVSQVLTRASGLERRSYGSRSDSVTCK